ncbi:hypothetical protein L873DRAFT_1843067 [Choiromyces venosus 120613-1]|uniref:Uncharacterized protein n=1 Tax=Choiromyces venosus 120613-1 TaxID=1336337 RepID=A0A3N4JTD2_9PEZI|nr:hypothetical protein L873DRAFT_1843067 [Choiromyces venosus 120613-1]
MTATSSDHPPSSTGGEPTLSDLNSKINTLQADWDSEASSLHQILDDHDCRHRQFEAKVNKQFVEVNNQLANGFPKADIQFGKVNNQPANWFPESDIQFAKVNAQLVNEFAKSTTNCKRFRINSRASSLTLKV